MEKHKVRYYPDSLEMEVDGIRYIPQKSKIRKIDGVSHIDYGIFTLKTNKIEEQRKFIIEKLKSQIPPERVVEELLKEMPSQKLSKLYHILKTKKPKIKRHDGCLGINVDAGKGNKMYLQLFG